ncbi:MAG: histidine ammonia-lyase [Alphaproteobacteria bacterium]|nr:histidine ammonia-lyase [Alphaproteobacteria bacterium]
MTFDVTARQDITLDAYHRVAWRREPVRIAAPALARIAACRTSFLALLDHDPDVTIYGVTTGYGQNARTKLKPDERRAHALRPPFAAAASFGEAVPERVARGIVLARLANFVGGHAAVTPRLAQAVAAMLDGPPLPLVPWPGQGGAGEILSLSHLFSDLATTFEPGEKEVLSLINGSPSSAALVADAALAARRRIAIALPVFALAVEAIRAPLEHYAADLDDLWGDVHEAEALRGLRRLLAGASRDRRPYQAPVSYRILPRVLGQAYRAVARAEEAARISLASVSDNPVYLPPDPDHRFGRVYSTGGYHNSMATPALDDLAAVWADLCLLADRQLTKLLDGRYSLLPDQLVGAGSEAYIGCLAMATVGYTEQARAAASRTLLPGSESGGFGQNDVAPLTFLAWSKEREAGWCIEAALANLAVVASQALFVTQRVAPANLAEFLDDVRKIVPPLTRAVRPGLEVAPLADHFRRRVFEG